MQIDLLLTAKGDVGLVADKAFDTDPSGVIYDALEQSLSLEFAQTFDSITLNVPVSGEFSEFLLHARAVHYGVVDRGRVVKALQLPLMHLNVIWD